jgi:hypothetical protein
MWYRYQLSSTVFAQRKGNLHTNKMGTERSGSIAHCIKKPGN